ncbi:ABC transporter ATP-binding protein [Sulfitobacter sp. R18_1]|uniref:ABC transporter ATP-binding protein n=1 Tax=Sulfitobacter sp. R18_1 TaxID=2821104 RepID=UPI001AD9B3D8|nr:ABC transporter ATP-binding protein [Sulfitobacter sp. R18_1]MBO9429993.1 ABC transporter ATP-binding protein [Sulfitobacter sp. R18_1]
MGNLLNIRGLRLEAGSRARPNVIIKGLDLELDRGEVLGLVGESGAGKSSAGLAAMGYVRDGVRFAGGSVEFDGTELIGMGRGQLRRLHGKRIAYVAQSAAASFNPAKTLIDQYTEAPRLHGVSGRAAAEQDAVALYRQMQLPNPEEIGFRYPHQVSGGQLQRAMTAMAMACRPDLIIFDEPTTALDVTTQIEVLGAIRDIVEQYDTAAIYITHDLAVVSQMADRICVMKDGAAVETAPTKTMLDAPQEDYTRSLWAVRSFRRPDAEAGEAPALIRCEGVSAAYGPMTVLDSLNFTFPRGQTTAVVGESGSGKSTLARVIAGLLPPVAGQFFWNDAPLEPQLAKRGAETLRNIQMIYQSADTSLNPRHNIREILSRPVRKFTGRKGQELQARVAELMDLVDLDRAFLDRKPSELSGGQKQRVGIARALAAEPEFIICDEVTSALDQLVAEGILRLLVRLQTELDLTFMFITHDLATVEAIAHKVIVLKNGQIVEQGGRDEIFGDPKQAYTKRLLTSVPQMDPEWLTEARARERSLREAQ